MPEHRTVASTSLAVWWTTVSIIVLSACGLWQAPYEEQTACSVPASTAAKVMGTNRFTATSPELEDAPLAEPDPARREPSLPACRIHTDDASLLILARLYSDDVIEDRAAFVSDQDGAFELASGQAHVNARGGTWVCGNVFVNAAFEEPFDADPADMRAALEALADTVGCFDFDDRP